MYPNADLKICQYLRLHMNITCPRFYIKTPFTFLRYAHVRYVKSLKNLQTLQANNSRILRMKNVNISGYCFYMKTNI